MAKVYKSGEWARSGRVMPGQRRKAKIIDQILQDGSVIQTESDQIFRGNKFKEVFTNLFPDAVEENSRLLLQKKLQNGRAVSFYTRNIYHLGGDWSSEKKRIEIGKDFLSFYQHNKQNDIETVLVGVYHYYPDGKDGVLLFVCFSAETYASRDVNNSAAHIHTIDLLNALKSGIYRRIDKSKNELLVLDEKHFVQHINALRTGTEIESIRADKQILNYFTQMYQSLPKKLYGIRCYEEMFLANDQNRNQGAWEGWYIEFFVKRYLKSHSTKHILWWSSKKKGDLDFDLKFPTEEWFYGDTKSDDAKKTVQGNKKSNVDFLVKEHNGRLWYIVFEFTPEKDSKHNYETTKWWNTKLGKDKLMSYNKRMKYSISIERLCVYEITMASYPYLQEYAVSAVKGKPRELKYRIPNKMKEFLQIYEYR